MAGIVGQSEIPALITTVFFFPLAVFVVCWKNPSEKYGDYFIFKQFLVLLCFALSMITLKNITHPNNLYTPLQQDRTRDILYIFLEYVPGGSLSAVISKFGNLDLEVCRFCQ